jgi:hypothetical protein
MPDDDFPVTDRERLRWHYSGLGVAALVAECMADGMEKGPLKHTDPVASLRALAKILREMKGAPYGAEGER